MISVNKIIVGIDFKKQTNSVLSYAVWLSKFFNCKNLLLFHILEYNLTPPSYLMPYISREKEKVNNDLNLISQNLKHYGLNVETKVIFGRLVQSINSLTMESEVLMVIGFKSYVTRPSTSERILRGVKIPIFIVQSDEFSAISPEKINVSKILCPIDFSDISLRALDVAKDISERINAKLIIVHVIPENKVRGIIEEPEGIEQYLEYLKEEAKQEMEKFAKGYDSDILVGVPSEEILKIAGDVDLVVIGSKGRSYVEAVYVGSVAEAVIKASKKPVLIIP